MPSENRESDTGTARDNAVEDEDPSHSSEDLPQPVRSEEQNPSVRSQTPTEHEMAMTLPSPSWRAKRRRKQSAAACALDLGQRLNQAANDLLESFSSTSNVSDGISIPVLALVWLLMIDQSHENEGGTPFVLTLSCRLSSSRVRSALQKLRSLKQIRITQSPTWPPVQSHRDKNWNFPQNVDPQDWLREYTKWQFRPIVSGEQLQRRLPYLQVLWMDQVPCSSFSSLLPKLQNLDVLRVDHTSLGDLHEYDIFQENSVPSVDRTAHGQSTTNKNLLDDDNSGFTVYQQLSHLAIAHCDTSFITSKFKSQINPPVWGHFPNLKSLSLVHNKGLTESSFTGLSLLTKLEKLNLSHNPLASVMPHIHLHVGHVLDLDVSDCGLSHTEGIDRLYSLVRLSLRSNLLSDLASIRGLTCLPNLVDIALLGNPIATLANRAAKASRKKSNLSVFTSNNKTHVLDPKTAYRLAVLDLFWQAGKQDIVLDGKTKSMEEFEKLRMMSYPEFPVPNLDTPPQIRSSDGVRRRRMKHRSIKLESSIQHPLLTRSSTAETPIISFHVANVVESLPAMVKQRPPQVDAEKEEFSNNSSVSDESIVVSEGVSKENLSSDLGELNVSITSKSPMELLDKQPEDGNDEVAADHPIIKDAAVDEQKEVLSPSDKPEETILQETEQTSSNDGPQSPLSNNADPGHTEPQSPVEAPSSFSKDTITERLKHLAFSPIEKKLNENGAVEIESQNQDLDTSYVSVVSKPPSEQSEPTALQSAMMASFVSPDWTKGVSHDDCLSVAGSASVFSQTDDQKKYKSAELNSAFVGPHTYKQLTIAADENIDIYFRMFVFSSATLPTVNTSIFSSLDPDEAEWRMVLEQFPRIQLWPSDRRIQESEAYENIGPQGLPVEEEFRRVWRERIIGCGQPALRRLTPTKTARLGFHGEIVFAAGRPSNSTYSNENTPEKAGSRAQMDTERGRPEAVVKERQVLLCLSSAAFYVIADNNTAQTRSRNSLSSFPRPIPSDACFAEALWPHALARHPWRHLNSVSIGFNFQRLTLHFMGLSAAPDATFAYTILTCNKHETVNLLKQIQELANSVDDMASTKLQIENDDPFVLDGLAAAVGSAIESICHFQILHQFWKKNDRGLVRRLCVVTDSMIYLLDEDYIGDGSQAKQHSISFRKEWGRPQYRVVDHASLSQIVSVQASPSDPRALAIAIRPSSRLYRTHNWRLLCKDREGAERLVEDARKAIKLSAM